MILFKRENAMIAELYDAGASEEKARAAAKTMADYDSRFNKIDQDLALLKTEMTLLKCFWLLVWFLCCSKYL